MLWFPNFSVEYLYLLKYHLSEDKMHMAIAIERTSINFFSTKKCLNCVVTAHQSFQQVMKEMGPSLCDRLLLQESLEVFQLLTLISGINFVHIPLKLRESC